MLDMGTTGEKVERIIRTSFEQNRGRKGEGANYLPERLSERIIKDVNAKFPQKNVSGSQISKIANAIMDGMKKDVDVVNGGPFHMSKYAPARPLNCIYQASRAWINAEKVYDYPNHREEIGGIISKACDESDESVDVENKPSMNYK